MVNQLHIALNAEDLTLVGGADLGGNGIRGFVLHTADKERDPTEAAERVVDEFSGVGSYTLCDLPGLKERMQSGGQGVACPLPEGDYPPLIIDEIETYAEDADPR
ncbi:hypothetical protein [Siphonobacter sp. BAB-5385]|uniref:hypothetical protein n=1 Tax=Siphonobacter sp. BAB-5385 TaxID=1864822 RepID=UPI0011403B8D|nr:hypothetical protein [Siphonobacter sp. BAB-5385]